LSLWTGIPPMLPCESAFLVALGKLVTTPRHAQELHGRQGGQESYHEGGKAMDEDFTQLADLDLLAECARVGNAVAALNRRYRALSDEFIRSAVARWQTQLQR
jgi:hypothetical protein